MGSLWPVTYLRELFLSQRAPYSRRDCYRARYLCLSFSNFRCRFSNKIPEMFLKCMCPINFRERELLEQQLFQQSLRQLQLQGRLCLSPMHQFAKLNHDLTPWCRLSLPQHLLYSQLQCYLYYPCAPLNSNNLFVFLHGLCPV